MTTFDALTAALELARNQLLVLAVGLDKKPFAGTRGVLDATSDEEVIAAMWEAHPEANVAVACGGSGPTVIDVDMDPNKGINGAESLTLLQERLGPLPQTRTSRTPRGGSHFFFRSPTDRKIKSTAGKLARGVDVRSDRGYVLVPPSAIGGVPYEWLNDAPLADLPQGWVEALTDRKVDDRQTAEGGRNSYLTREAGRLRNLNMEPDDALDRLLALNDSRCEPPLPRPEVVKIRDSIWRYEPAFQLTDVGNAERFVYEQRGDVRWIEEYRRWLVWRGHFWAEDTGEAERRCKRTMRGMLARAASIEDNGKRTTLTRWANQSESAARIAAALQLARSEMGVAVKAAQLDADPWAFVTQNAVIDLRTGRPTDPRRDALLTKIGGTQFDATANCQTWLAFLARVLRDDAALIDFLQRAVGYSLTGDTSEHCIFILYGTGANGKTTFINTIKALAGDYGRSTHMQTWMVRKNPGVPDDIAALRGVRLATATEGEDGQRLAESQIKQVAGGDVIAARKLYGDWFEFAPTFKLWMATNHRPQIHSDDYAIWRRIRLVPFEVQIPADERDHHLQQKLLAELPGILNWALQGCTGWLARGLEAPMQVAAASNQYREEQDRIGTFLEECCEVSPENSGTSTSASDLYGAYRRWCESNGCGRLSQPRFKEKLLERRLVQKRLETGLRWLGVTVNEDWREMF